jgi:hypothetical protein
MIALRLGRARRHRWHYATREAAELAAQAI